MLDKTEMCPMGSGKIRCWVLSAILYVKITQKQWPLFAAPSIGRGASDSLRFPAYKWGFAEVLQRLLRAWEPFQEKSFTYWLAKKQIITNPCKFPSKTYSNYIQLLFTRLVAMSTEGFHQVNKPASVKASTKAWHRGNWWIIGGNGNTPPIGSCNFDILRLGPKCWAYPQIIDY